MCRKRAAQDAQQKSQGRELQPTRQEILPKQRSFAMRAAHNVRPQPRWNKTVTLDLEPLENRALPSAMPVAPIQAPVDQTFLATLYQGELKRIIDPSGLASWGNLLSQTGDRTQVAQGILSSNEFLDREVAIDYNTLLGRAPDAGGLQNFVQALENGMTPQEVQAQIMGSDEFFARVGGTANTLPNDANSTSGLSMNAVNFLNAVYGAVLNRTVDAAGILGWSPLATDASGRTEIGRDIEASQEASQLMVATMYQDTLGRSPDANGLTYWSGQLEQGISQTTVVADLLGSAEYFEHVQAYAAQAGTTDPNAAASGFIAANHLFTSQPRVVPPYVPVVGPGGNVDTGPNAPTGNVGDNSGVGDGTNAAGNTSGTDTTGATPDTSSQSPNNSCDNTGTDNTSTDCFGDCSNDGSTDDGSCSDSSD
jgi:hypothetical protein